MWLCVCLKELRCDSGARLTGENEKISEIEINIYRSRSDTGFWFAVQDIDQLEMLMNHSNSEFEGIFRGPDRHGFPIHTDFSLIREINTGEHVHQRSLSTTILS